MSVSAPPTNTLTSPMTLGAVHALLTEWRRIHSPSKARIPYFLILDIASLVGQVPVKNHIREMLGLSNDQLSYFKSVYRVTYNRSPGDLDTQSTETPHAPQTGGGETSHTLPNTPAKDHPRISDHYRHTGSTTNTDSSPRSAPSESGPHFIKATIPADAFSACLNNTCGDTPAPHETNPSANVVSSPCHPSVSQYNPTLSQAPLDDAQKAPSILSPPPPTPASVGPDDDHRAPIPITLVNQNGITFTAALSEQQVVLFMHTFIQK